MAVVADVGLRLGELAKEALVQHRYTFIATSVLMIATIAWVTGGNPRGIDPRGRLW
jgi:hypothetical protein